MLLLSEGNPFWRRDIVRVPRAAQNWTGSRRRDRVHLSSTGLSRPHEHPRAALKAQGGTQPVVLVTPQAREQTMTRPDGGCCGGCFFFFVNGWYAFRSGLFGEVFFFLFLLTTSDDACHRRPVDGSAHTGYSCVVVRGIPIAYVVPHECCTIGRCGLLFLFAGPCLTKGERVGAVLKRRGVGVESSRGVCLQLLL